MFGVLPDVVLFEIRLNALQASLFRATNAAEWLKRYGKTIDDAVNFYIENLDRLAASVPFSTLPSKIRDEFKRRAANNEASSRHIETMSETLTKLETTFGSHDRDEGA